jgi:(+)-abscisic acid 8'-hydroxylase
MLIPKGWKVMPLFRNIHHNPDYFPDPQKFHPSRFKVMVGLLVTVCLTWMQ